MEKYVGIIYFKNGNKEQTGTYSGPGAEQSCERETAQRFEMRSKTAINDFFKPTRYEVKRI